MEVQILSRAPDGKTAFAVEDTKMETAIRCCGIISFGAGVLYLALFVLLLAGVLKETKTFKVVIVASLIIVGLGATLANFFGGYPFGGHSQLNRIIAYFELGLVVSGVWLIVRIFRTKKDK